MIVRNLTKNTLLSERCWFADSFWNRLVGLIGRRFFSEGEGMIFDRCRAIHTFGMRFAIDVVWLNKDFQVLRAVESLLPYRVCAQPRAAFVLELPEGTIRRTHTAAGDNVHFDLNGCANSPQPPCRE
ncbi:MAG: DUF192 domain-containing protein [Verrucomicrobia bacterium]|nr:DUF192 domain-containing protein [Verrucomicrobiota bacterium]